MMKLTSMALTFSILLLVFLVSAILIKKTESVYTNKWMNFECGFLNLSSGRLPFSFQFFLIALLFLIFDIEISVLLAYPLEGDTLQKKACLYTFLMILVLGFFYEWKKGKINWPQ